MTVASVVECLPTMEKAIWLSSLHRRKMATGFGDVVGLVCQLLQWPKVAILRTPIQMATLIGDSLRPVSVSFGVVDTVTKTVN